MRFLLINHIQNAQQSLKRNRMRSYLTMLGVTIGVASITIILSLSAGASKLVSAQVDSLGGNIAVIRPGQNVSDPLAKLTSAPGKDFSTSSLTEEDIAQIQQIEHIQKVAPLMVISGTIKGIQTSTQATSIVATTPDLADIVDLRTGDGQFLDDQVNANSVVIGAQLSVDIFGTEHSIGQTLTIRGKSFTVIGILTRISNPINYNAIDFDNAALIGLEMGKELNKGVLQIQQINVKSDSITNLDQAIVTMNKTLLAAHDGENDFTILSGDEISQPTSQLFYAIAGVTAAVAGISLLVGGISIMNIMLVSVAERSREIGIRKALGASNGDITWQFLMESVAISVAGGVTGYLLGYAIAFIISTFLTFNPAINWEIAGVALGVSFVMGTVFGLYPAFKASRKHPIDSLREYS
jgi:ABC-type antimicrobial peptide transport system permease subunit